MERVLPAGVAGAKSGQGARTWVQEPHGSEVPVNGRTRRVYRCMVFGGPDVVEGRAASGNQVAHRADRSADSRCLRGVRVVVRGV